ncbi:hypothetical protein [uncultured Nocardioides sp.]|uniref:hypothetical protein n=1 Tax=uncultured Nocardioides sp. TaxID=198441 RepID=UPI000C503F9E|nr:hypothetical protein [uncultured Nocardioides sp.]MAO79962.1 hypothetical protein [Nocardioides sp.]
MLNRTVSTPFLASVIAHDPRVAEIVRSAGDLAGGKLPRPVLVSRASLDPEELASSDLVVLDLSTTGPASMEIMMDTVGSAPHVPILALVAPGDPDLASRALVAGAGAVVRFDASAPSAPTVVGDAIREFLGSIQKLPRDVHIHPRGPLASSHPDLFGTYTRRYAREVLARSDRHRGIREHTSELHQLIGDLTAIDAAPVDLSDLHMVALRALCRDTSTAGQRRLVHDARVVLVESMGLMAGQYRERCLYGRRLGGADDGELA